MDPWQAAQMTHNRFPSMTEVVYGKSKDTPAPIGMQVQNALNNNGYPTNAATANAVNVAADAQGTDQPAYPTEFRRGFDAASAASAIPKAALPPGKMPPNPNNGNDPYPGAPKVENITNRLALKQSAGVDFGLPRMQQQYQQVPTGGGGGGGGGLFSPSLMSAIQGYHDLSGKAEDGSIAGAWRSRGFAKQRDRLIAGAVAAQNADSGTISANASALGANASMMRAQNEPWLEGMKNFVATRGQDLNYGLGMQQDATHKYGIDATTGAANYRTNVDAETTRRGQDYTLAPHLPQMTLDTMGVEAYKAGDPASGKEYMTAGRQPQLPRAPQFHEDMQGNTVILHPDGSQQVLSIDAKKKLAASSAAKPYQKKAAEDILGGK